MSTNMTGFRCFPENWHLCALDESSLCMEGLNKLGIALTYVTAVTWMRTGWNRRKFTGMWLSNVFLRSHAKMT